MADEPDLDLDALQEQLAALSVEQFLASAASTLATLAVAKLERRDLPQAKKAIDALAALQPQLDSELAGELGITITNLQLAYVQALSG